MVGPGSSRGYNQYLSIKEERSVRSWPATYSFILYGAVRGVVPYIFIFVLKGNLLDLIGGVIFPRDSLAGGPLVGKGRDSWKFIWVRLGRRRRCCCPPGFAQKNN